MNYPQMELAMNINGRLQGDEWPVLMALCFHADKDHAKVWTRQEVLAKECHTSLSSVERAIRGLKEQGFITKGKRVKNGNIYIVHVERGTVQKSDEKPKPNPSNRRVHTRQNDGLKDSSTRQIEGSYPSNRRVTPNLNPSNRRVLYKEELLNISECMYEQEVIVTTTENDDLEAEKNDRQKPLIEPQFIPVAQAICEVSGSDFNSLSQRQFDGIVSSLEVITTSEKNLTPEEMAREVVARFRPPVYTLERLPYTSQIGQWWERQGKQLQLQQTNTKPEVSKFAANMERFRALRRAGKLEAYIQNH